jgi:hypothetical protein
VDLLTAEYPTTTVTDDGLRDLARHLSALGEAVGGAWARQAGDTLLVEQAADVLVTVEAGVAAVAHTAHDPDLIALTRWRVRRDLARTLADTALLAEEPALARVREVVRTAQGDWINGSAADAADAFAWLMSGDSLRLLRDGIAAGLPRDPDPYLSPAIEAVRACLSRISEVVDEDYRDSHPGVRAGLAYLLDPVSAVHTAGQLIRRSDERLREGNARTATVARRWCYARVRIDTLEGLSDRHVGKSRTVVAGGPVRLSR